MSAVAMLGQPPPPPPPPPPKLSNKRVVFTTPSNYAPRLAHLLRQHGADPIWCPTVSVEPTPLTKSSLAFYLRRHQPGVDAPLEGFSAIAFTSRAGIAALSDAMEGITENPLAEEGEPFVVAALGSDAELLRRGFKLADLSSRVGIFVPTEATPMGLVREMGDGGGRKVLCPVPSVIDLEEPPVVPEFLAGFKQRNWIPVRVDAYETRWVRGCARALMGEGVVDAVVFTSTAEVEGLLKSLNELGLDWNAFRDAWPSLVVAAHGPVTASGAGRLGVAVDVVSSKFVSFQGVVDEAMGWEACLCGLRLTGFFRLHLVLWIPIVHTSTIVQREVCLEPVDPFSNDVAG